MRQSGADFLEQRDAIHRHHAHIADDDRKRLRLQGLQGRLAAIDGNIGAPGQFQRIADCLAQAGIILDNQNGQTVLTHRINFQYRRYSPARS